MQHPNPILVSTMPPILLFRSVWNCACGIQRDPKQSWSEPSTEIINDTSSPLRFWECRFHVATDLFHLGLRTSVSVLTLAFPHHSSDNSYPRCMLSGGNQCSSSPLCPSLPQIVPANQKDCKLKYSHWTECAAWLPVYQRSFPREHLG